MPLTPIDVQQKTFGTALRGYDLDEVDDFLDEVVTSLKDYEQRLRDAQERIASLENELEGRGDAEGAIARALVAAQRSADSIVEEARQEARTILSEARGQATALTTERDDEQKRLLEEIDGMKAAVESLRAGLRKLGSKVDEEVAQMAAAIDETEATVSPELPSEAGEDEFETPVYQGDISRYTERMTDAEPASSMEASEEADTWRQGGPRHAQEDQPSGEPEDSDPWSFVDSDATEQDGSGGHVSDWRHDTGDLDESIEIEEATPAVASDEDQTGARVPRPWEQS